jgi:hypothetical protein
MSIKFSDLISTYDGHGDFSQWIEKLEFVAKLQKIEDLASFMPLFLEKGAFAVYQSLTDVEKRDYTDVKKALTLAFSADQFQAFDLFVTRTLKPEESVDVYYADLKRLLNLVDKSSAEDILKCAFVRGLPGSLRSQLTSACVLNKMSVETIVNRARSLRRAEAGSTCFMTEIPNKNDVEEKVCYNCRKSGHFAQDCTFKKQRRCFTCGDTEHLANNCPKKMKKYCFICGDMKHLANKCSRRICEPCEPKNL